MPPVPDRIRELRGLISTTFSKTHTDASSGTWAAGTARKPRALSWDGSGLGYDSEEDPTLQSIHTVNPANIPTTRKGSASFDMWLEGGESDGSQGELATWLEAVMGGCEAGSANDACEASCTTTLINATGHSVAAGQGVLIGARGDSGGEAEGRVATSVNTNNFSVTLAYQGAPATDAVIRIGTTVFWDPTATQEYIDLLAIGYSAEDQIQTIGGHGNFALSGLSMNELPRVAYTVNVADWQEVPSGERDALEPGTAPDGNNPAQLRGTGMLRIGDNGSTTLSGTAFKVADLSINPGITYAPDEGYNGVNGLEGWVKMGCRPTIEATVMLEGGTDPLPGFYNDFVNGTAKQVYAQFGSTAQKCVMIDMPRAFFSVAPTRVAGGNFAAVKITMHGGVLPTMSESTANYLINSPIRIHFF